MMPEPAQYLLRFDDLCPTMDHAKWSWYESLIQEFGIKPILAVVPQNEDEELKVNCYDATFWERMRVLEKAGATIALHGYRHLCCSRGGSLCGFHAESEFAGVAVDVQREWVRRGVEILRKHGLSPSMWVAPRHGFNRNTLVALAEVGISVLSDSFARRPFVRHDFVWIPQQLWGVVLKQRGLWTICIHSNTETQESLEELQKFLFRYSERFTSVQRVLEEYVSEPLNVAEKLCERFAVARRRLSRVWK